MRPPNPGGLDVAGESETAFETSAGEDTDAQLDLSKMSETPVARPPEAAPEAGFLHGGEGPAESRACRTAAADGDERQRGAARRLRQPAQAERAWTALSSRFPAIGNMGKLVIPFSGGIRLRATASSPPRRSRRARCSRRRANCFVAQ